MIELTPEIVTPAAEASALALARASATAAVRAWRLGAVGSSTRKVTPSTVVAPAATAASTRSPTLAMSWTVTDTMFVSWKPVSLPWPLLAVVVDRLERQRRGLDVLVGDAGLLDGGDDLRHRVGGGRTCLGRGGARDVDAEAEVGHVGRERDPAGAGDGDRVLGGRGVHGQRVPRSERGAPAAAARRPTAPPTANQRSADAGRLMGSTLVMHHLDWSAASGRAVPTG